ncbi:hypothetical protein BH18ACT15_BH18ACT15_08550 [soil metagenome]
MMARRGEGRGQSGMTLIEVMAALGIFAIITVGLVPLLLSSIKGVDLNRSFQRAQELATQSMERVRNLPYFESVTVQGAATPFQRRDVLDLYFPNLLSGYDSGTKTFTTTCTPTSETPTASATSACPAPLANGVSSIPQGVTLTYAAQFVTPSATGFAPVTPLAGYSWATVATEKAPSATLKMVVTAAWSSHGQPRSTKLSTLIAVRDLSKETIRASSNVEYLVQTTASYEDAGTTSRVVANLGGSESRIATESVAGADQTVDAGSAVLTQVDPPTADGGVASIFGAASALSAPPNAYPGPTVSAAAASLPNPLVTGSPIVARLGASQVYLPGVRVVNELPEATGTFKFTEAGGVGSQPTYWATNQASATGYLGLDTTLPMVSVDKVWTTSRSTGGTNAVATALTPTAGRKVGSAANASLARLDLLPTTFISDTRAGYTDYKSVIVLTGFSASVACNSTANPATLAESARTGSWTATLNYFTDSNPANGVPVGTYQQVTIGGTTAATGTNTLGSVRTTNPLVYDKADNTQDVYLFEDSAANKKGYLKSWSSLFTVGDKSADTNRRTTSVNLKGAISIDTARTDPSKPATELQVAIGSLSCQAEDKR